MRDTQLKKLRPNIPAISEKDLKSDIEKFHHQILRPILKFQNEMILDSFLAEMRRFKIDFEKLSKNEKQNKIQSTLQSNQKFQMFLLGQITGLFAKEEFRFFLENRAPIKKRILEMTAERIRSQLMD